MTQHGQIDQQNAAYLAYLRDQGEQLTPAEARLVARWAREHAPEPFRVPWFAVLAGAALWVVMVLAVLVVVRLLGL